MSRSDYIPSTHFNKMMSVEERWETRFNLGAEHWESVKSKLSENQQITKGALKIRTVMRKKLRLDLFPTVFRLAGKGWRIKDGNYAFKMVDKHGREIYFSKPARYYKRMDRDYFKDGNLIL